MTSDKQPTEALTAALWAFAKPFDDALDSMERALAAALPRIDPSLAGAISKHPGGSSE